MAVISSEVITVSTTPIGISTALVGTINTPTWVQRALLAVELGPVRLTRKLGATPANGSYVGMVIPANTVIEIVGLEDIINLRMIKSDVTDAKVYVELEKGDD